MRLPAHRPGNRVFAALFSFGIGALAAGCNADLETVCQGGPCEGTGGGAPATTTSKGGAGGGATCAADAATGDIPCDVHAVLAAKCITCHNADHLMGAPIDLLACDRFHELDCGEKKARSQVAHDFISSGFMPLGGMTLTADEKKTLLDWLDACSPCETAGSACGDPPGAKACGG